MSYICIIKKINMNKSAILSDKIEKVTILLRNLKTSANSVDHDKVDEYYDMILEELESFNSLLDFDSQGYGYNR